MGTLRQTAAWVPSDKQQHGYPKTNTAVWVPSDKHSSMGTFRQTQQYGYPQTKHSSMGTFRQTQQYGYLQTNTA